MQRPVLIPSTAFANPSVVSIAPIRDGTDATLFVFLLLTRTCTEKWRVAPVPRPRRISIHILGVDIPVPRTVPRSSPHVDVEANHRQYGHGSEHCFPCATWPQVKSERSKIGKERK